jgi:serine/threonine protein phosphatase PrpC
MALHSILSAGVNVAGLQVIDIHKSMCQLGYGGATHVGLVRENNEDSYAAVPELGLWLVADGLGGHEGGEIASQIVAEHVAECIRGGMSLEEAIGSSHDAVVAASLDGRGKKGMASTVVAAVLTGNAYRIAWVGDSRAYLWNGEYLMQLTRDHSMLQDLLDKGVLEQEEAIGNPLGSVLTQCIGQERSGSPKIDVEEGELCRDDRILLCSDGLYGEVGDDEMVSIFAQGVDDQGMAEALVRAALANGGSDNVTVLVISAQ